MTKDADLEMLRSHCEQLGEHFDSVQIFATGHEADETTATSYGSGNWYARIGQVQEWIIKNEEEVRCNSRTEAE